MKVEDLRSLGSVAAFIAARLNYVLPECNSGVRGGKLVSTIKVSQHKEKFFFIRIYCDLADPGLVQEKWKTVRSETDPEEVPADFKAGCFRNDAWHYRTCYLGMMKLVPHLKERIRAQADYYELLFEDAKEMSAHFDMLAEPDPEDRDPKYDRVEYYRKKYGVATNDELKDTLAKLYREPSWREMQPDA